MGNFAGTSLKSIEQFASSRDTGSGNVPIGVKFSKAEGHGIPLKVRGTTARCD